MAYLKEEIKAGIIIIAAFVILSGFVILIGGSETFEKLDSYYVRVKNAAGIEAGAQVKLGGVRIGKVQGVNPPSKPGEPVTIKIGVKKDTVIYKGTIASISQVGLMGDLYILLSVDTIEKGTTDKYKNGETIPLAEQVQLAQLMARFDSISQSVDGLIRDVNKIFSEKNIKEVDSLLKNANTTLISGTNNLDKVGSALKGTAVKLERDLDEVEGLVKDARSEITPLLKRTRAGVDNAIEMIKTFDEAAKSADKTIKGADRVIDRQSQNLDKLLNSLNRTSEDLRETLHEIKNKPWSVIYKEEQGKEE